MRKRTSPRGGVAICPPAYNEYQALVGNKFTKQPSGPGGHNWAIAAWTPYSGGRTGKPLFGQASPGYSRLYFAPNTSIARTLPADRPVASKFIVWDSQVSAIALASSLPMTRAPIVMIWALFDKAARSAE